MPYIRLPFGIKVALEYQVYGKIVVNVYHVTTTDPITSIKLLDIAEVFEAWFASSMASAVTANISLATVTALNLDVENGEKVTLAVTPIIPGTRAGDAVSNNVALVASFATDKTGRSFRGRSYVAGLSELDVNSNGVDSVFATGITIAYMTLITDLLVENASLVVASFQSDNAPRAEGIATAIEAVSTNLRVDTQRRRLPS